MTDDPAFDLGALVAEADQTPHTFALGGETFSLPQLRDWPHEATTAADRGLFAAALRVVFGDEDWQRFAAAADSATHARGPTYRLFEALFDQMAQLEGIGDSGNGARSGSGSRSTKGR